MLCKNDKYSTPDNTYTTYSTPVVLLYSTIGKKINTKNIKHPPFASPKEAYNFQRSSIVFYYLTFQVILHKNHVEINGQKCIRIRVRRKNCNILVAVFSLYSQSGIPDQFVCFFPGEHVVSGDTE